MSQILDANSPIATVFGGSGFVGKYVVRRLVKRGWRVRVAVRKPNEALFLKTYGEVGQVEVLKCSIFDINAVSLCISGSVLVVNATAGILNETSKTMFKKYYIDGPELIARQCFKFKVKKLIHISSVGVDSNSTNIYSRSKAIGEQKVIENFVDAAIVRASLIFGHEDRFFNRYASMAFYSPVLPLIGSLTKVQPVYVDDVAYAIEKIALGRDLKGVFELGGPEIFTFTEIIRKMLIEIRRKRVIFSIPFGTAKFMALVFEVINKLTLRLAPLPFTQDNVRQLQLDNVVSTKMRSFKFLNIDPKNLDTILPLYLYSFRPHGQYNEITRSANKVN